MGHAAGHTVTATLGRQAHRGPRSPVGPAPRTHARPLVAWTRAAHRRPCRVAGINKAWCVLLCRAGGAGEPYSLTGHLPTITQLPHTCLHAPIHGQSPGVGHALAPPRLLLIKEGDVVPLHPLPTPSPPRPCPGVTLLPRVTVQVNPTSLVASLPRPRQAAVQVAAGIGVQGSGRVFSWRPEHDVALVRRAEAQRGSARRHQLIVGGGIHATRRLVQGHRDGPGAGRRRGLLAAPRGPPQGLELHAAGRRGGGRGAGGGGEEEEGRCTSSVFTDSRSWRRLASPPPTASLTTTTSHHQYQHQSPQPPPLTRPATHATPRPVLEGGGRLSITLSTCNRTMK